MIAINNWIDEFLKALSNTFAERVLFVGLQGSYARGEATETSDIDIVVILDELSISDIQVYNTMLDNLPHRDLICGFISGRKEIENWEPSDIFQFYYDTKSIIGDLEEFIPFPDKEDIVSAIKIGACNIYHGCVHNMLYEKSEDILRGLYKSASFIVQAIYFIETGKYITHLKDLLDKVSDSEKVILNTFSLLKNGGMVKFQEMSAILFDWSRKWIEETSF